jgi:hypothetical protein
MTYRNFSGPAPLIAIVATIGGALALPMPAFGQTVADRALNDVRVEQVGGCTTLTVSFNIRVQMLSFFPASGRELHIRVRPLDAAAALSQRESLRTPASVSQLRSIEFEGDNPSGPVLSLFFTRDTQFEVTAGEQPQTLVIRLNGPDGACAITQASPAPQPETQAQAGGRPPVQPARPEVPIPAGLYVVNLASTPTHAGDFSAAQQALISGGVVYETEFERDSQTWHRLRLGFFETRAQAEAELARVLPAFPGVAGRLPITTVAVTAPTATAVAPASLISTEADLAETARLTTEAEDAIRSTELDRAIQLLTNALTKPENANTPRALELLGLTRERKGQMAHAQAEYEEYLRRYPNGEAADRVRQRLAALSPTGGAVTTPALRAASGEVRSAAAWTWGARGSFSQFYFRDQSRTKFIDAARPEINPEIDNSVNLNQLLTAADLTISGGNDLHQLQLRAAGSYTANFRASGNDVKSLTALYLDYSESQLGASLRVGRQTRNSAGVLGRFDGGLIGWKASPKVKLNVVAGFPVLTSRQLFIERNRFFYGASVDYGARNDAPQTTLYWFDQRAKGGFTDRRSVGLESRLLLPRFNAFTILDYDVKQNKLNLGLLTLNYNFPDNSNLSITADYRRSPLLTTTNALIGQLDTLSMLPITDLRGLRPFFTDPQIYQMARDRTLLAKSLTVSYSRPITPWLQSNLDFTMTDTGGTPGTPASAGTLEIAALPATGREYYYGAQLVGTGLLMQNDIYILSARYADSQRSRTYSADFTARVPISQSFRLSPRVRYGYRTDKLIDSKFSQVQPTMRFNYYPISHSEIEIEIGANFSRQRTVVAGAAATTTENGFVVNAGYRIDF